MLVRRNDPDCRSKRKCHAARKASQLAMVAAIVAAVGASGCGSGDVDASGSDSSNLGSTGELDTPQYLDQGWTAEMRAGFYRANQGIRLFPYAWLLALEQENSADLFRTTAHMQSFGFLADEASPKNPDGLPIGLTRDEDPKSGKSWAGLSCAACHTADYSYKGTHIRIDGGHGRFEIGAFVLAVARAMNATLGEATKFDRFATRLLGKNASAESVGQLKSEMSEFTTSFAATAKLTAGTRRFGPGRLDTQTAIRNNMACAAIGVPANCLESQAATAAPALWLTSELDWVQTNGNQHIPLARDVAQALGLGHVRLTPAGVEHSVNVPNLREIEGLIKTLKAPKWPERVFGTIDPGKALAGNALYETHCQQCHALTPYPLTAPNPFGTRTIAVKRVPVADIGVDPTYIKTFFGRRSDPGPLAATFSPDQIGPDGLVPDSLIVKTVVGAVLKQTFIEMKASPEDQIKLFDGREPLTPTVADLQSVVAKPLPGVALRGYFLHNGSVRTLYQLLLPAALREKSFFVGSTEYDPGQVGYVSDPTLPNAYEFRVDEHGDSNAGHEYGTSLTDVERYQLIEFMKTL
jgi:mono/diheme cytochrome c family protein